MKVKCECCGYENEVESTCQLPEPLKPFGWPAKRAYAAARAVAEHRLSAMAIVTVKRFFVARDALKARSDPGCPSDSDLNRAIAFLFEIATGKKR